MARPLLLIPGVAGPDDPGRMTNRVEVQMFDFTDPEGLIGSIRNGTADSGEIWLFAINLALGLVVLACAALVLGAVAREAWARLRHRVRTPALAGSLDPYTMAVPGLGTTMADGGTPLTEESGKVREGNGSDR